MDQAACKGHDPELWFPPKGQTHIALEAQIICFGCPVRKECKDYKEATASAYGMWAGEFSKRE